MTRATIRKNGKPLTNAETCRRYRANKKARLKAERAAERRSRCSEAGINLGVHTIAVAEITETDLASGRSMLAATPSGSIATSALSPCACSSRAAGASC